MKNCALINIENHNDNNNKKQITFNQQTNLSSWLDNTSRGKGLLKSLICFNSQRTQLSFGETPKELNSKDAQTFKM